MTGSPRSPVRQPRSAGNFNGTPTLHAKSAVKSPEGPERVEATVSATRIQFGAVRPPQCTDPASAVIAAVIQAGEAEYAIRGDQLIISTKSGMLVYQP